MAALDELCDDEGERVGPRLAVLTGPRGVGKSAVVRRWAQLRADRYPGGQIYVNLGGTSSNAVSAVDVIASVLPRVGVPPDDFGGVLDGRIERFRSAVAGKRVLLVLDHAATASQVIPFATSSAHVVVTATAAVDALRLYGARFHDVKRLELPFARALFCEIAGLDDPDQATEAVVTEVVQRLCGCLPLAITLCGAMYASTRRRRTLAEWFDDLRRSDRPLSRFRVDGEPPLHEVFDEVYRGLDALEARVYRAVGALPADRFSVAHVAAMLSMPAEAADCVLSELVDKCILTRSAGGYEVHRLIQWHARDAAETHGADEAGAVRRRVVDFVTACAQSMDRAMVNHRLRIAVVGSLPEISELSDLGAANSWFDLECAAALGYMRLARDCGRWRHVCAMSEAWSSPLYARGQFDRARDVSDLGVEVAEFLDDPAIYVRLLGQSALVCIATGDLSEASERLGRAYRSLGLVVDDHVKLRLSASLLEWSGKLSEAKGDIAQAEAEFVQARDYSRALGNARGEAIQDYHLAKLAAERGNHAQAAELAAGSLSRLDAAGDSLTFIRFSIFRARCLIKAREPQLAHSELTELCASTLYSGSDFLIGQMQECIAAAAEALGDHDGARNALRSALAAYTRSGSDNADEIASRLAAITEA
ncbi:NB-ARC domain-containing protein [Mycobacteroides abscessus]|uniref:NB-ARC domain-containing protein n=1 Tax=Mycobacteroides abscessus TaxID=36809 RepID=UPI000D6A7078|nr:NB-ARC domain-containing protein [Mycobacteroides abscessus]RIT42398.1 hypothetical protein D2E80_22280 [Mycobacteroides abscessus]